MKSVIKECKRCGGEFSTKDRARSKFCSVTCGRTKTDEDKEKISKARKEYLSKNKDKHPWKNKDKFKSVPCEIVKQALIDRNIKFVEEWNPIEDRNFAIDIAFPDIKLGIEINGNQHYDRNGELKPYYKERHDIITSNGWELLEYHYSIAYNIDILIDNLKIKEQPDYREYIKAIYDKKQQKMLNAPKKRGVKQKEKTDIKWESYKDKIINSGIDFSKLGWCQQVSYILNISPQKVGKWMERHLPDFYEKCYKRKRSDI